MRLDSCLEINLNLLEKNLSHLRILTNKEVIFMIKADAYGHGILDIYSFAFNELGVRSFGCASLGEALFIRKSFPQDCSEIYVFSDINFALPNILDQYVSLNIRPVIHSLEDLKFFIKDSNSQKLALVLKINTGMNRLGIEASDIEQVVEVIKSSGRKTIDHLMTHFASSYKPFKIGDKTDRQYKGFLKIKEAISDSGLSIRETSVANSGAIEQGVGLEESHVRPGLMLYGPQSTLVRSEDKPLWNGNDISSLKTKVLQLQELSRGTPVGYGSPVLPTSGKLVTIPLGYGDGVMTYYSGALINSPYGVGKIFGRVNMDLTFILFEKDSSIKVGDELRLWGAFSQNRILDFSSRVKTNPYQIMSGVTQRVPRKYIS